MILLLIKSLEPITNILHVNTRFFYKQHDPEIIRNFKQSLSNKPGWEPGHIHLFHLKSSKKVLKSDKIKQQLSNKLP